MIILSIITCGIYNLFWIYLARSEFQKISGNNNINPGLELLLTIICFPYFYYWIYKFSSDIAKYQFETGRFVNNTGLVNLILAVLGLGLISELIIQSQLNDLAD